MTTTNSPRETDRSTPRRARTESSWSSEAAKVFLSPLTVSTGDGTFDSTSLIMTRTAAVAGRSCTGSATRDHGVPAPRSLDGSVCAAGRTA
jgi:hypothetical protein